MFSYEKRLQFPVNIKNPNAMLAQAIISQYGGPDGEMGASMRYLSQRYAAPYREVASILTDIGTEELGHLEMVATIVHQLTRGLSMEEIEDSGFANYYVDHTIGIWPQAASGMPFSSAQFQSTGDIIADLMEDMAAEQKARLTYDNILRLVCDDSDVYEPIKFLRAREIVHFQRFGEANREHCSKSEQKNTITETHTHISSKIQFRLSHQKKGQVYYSFPIRSLSDNSIFPIMGKERKGKRM